MARQRLIEKSVRWSRAARREGPPHIPAVDFGHAPTTPHPFAPSHTTWDLSIWTSRLRCTGRFFSRGARRHRALPSDVDDSRRRHYEATSGAGLLLSDVDETRRWAEPRRGARETERGVCVCRQLCVRPTSSQLWGCSTGRRSREASADGRSHTMQLGTPSLPTMVEGRGKRRSDGRSRTIQGAAFALRRWMKGVSYLAAAKRCGLRAQRRAVASRTACLRARCVRGQPGDAPEEGRPAPTSRRSVALLARAQPIATHVLLHEGLSSGGAAANCRGTDGGARAGARPGLAQADRDAAVRH